MKRALLFSLALSLAGCGSEQFEDLDRFVKESGKDLRGKIEPLPEIKPYEPFVYNAFDIPDPFKPRKMRPVKGGANQPNLDRPKETLESYPLEGLAMVGTLRQNNITFALIKTPDKALYRVKAGNYMGQNFGMITQITDTEITLKEIVQDSAGDWTEKVSTIPLQE